MSLAFARVVISIVVIALSTRTIFLLLNLVAFGRSFQIDSIIVPRPKLALDGLFLGCPQFRSTLPSLLLSRNTL